MQLSQKETELLKEIEGQEKLCMEKYSEASSRAQDGQLKNLFSQLSGNEKQHYDTVCSIMQGNVPSMSGGSSSQSGSSSSQSTGSFSSTYGNEDSEAKKNDCFLCTDMLAMEKHASHVYDTCIFEFKDSKIRDSLNHIQKEEQEHGKMIYDYMSANGMYN